MNKQTANLFENGAQTIFLIFLLTFQMSIFNRSVSRSLFCIIFHLKVSTRCIKTKKFDEP